MILSLKVKAEHDTADSDCVIVFENHNNDLLHLTLSQYLGAHCTEDNLTKAAFAVDVTIVGADGRPFPVVPDEDIAYAVEVGKLPAIIKAFSRSDYYKVAKVVARN